MFEGQAPSTHLIQPIRAAMFVSLLNRLLEFLPDRYRFCGFIQRFCNILLALRQYFRSKLLAIGSLQPLGRIVLLIRPNSVPGGIQFPELICKS